MSSRTTRRSQPSALRSLAPTITVLETRTLPSANPLVAHPMFVLGSFGSGSPPSGAFTPAQVEQGYGFNQITFNGVTGDGTGETIAIVDAYDDPNIQSDLNTFDTEFGLPALTVDRVNQTGGTTYPSKDSTGGWELEESLDVEWAHAMAPGASIMLVEASSADDSDLLTAVSYAAAHANVVSMSWGGAEFSGETADDSDFDVPGVAFVASAGDDGAPASWPSASPNVLSVGGTSLTLNAENDWSSEVGWSGSGGAPSAYESQPAYQNGVVTQTSSARATADVAYDASPSTGFAVYDSVAYSGTVEDWLEVGGTSAGAPQWSALLAIADQGLAKNHQSALDTSSPQQVMSILYQNTDDFHDITSGTSTGTPHYSCGPGYDYVTGIGTPIANFVVGSLDGALTEPHDTLVLTASTTETAGTSLSLTVTAENSSGQTDTGYTGTIDFSSSDAQADSPANFTFVPSDDGTYTFTVTLKTAGSQSITAEDTSNSAIAGMLSGIEVSPGAASQLVLSGMPSSPAAGVSQTLTVTALDPYGNLATGYTGTVAFTSTDPLAVLPVEYTFSSYDAGKHSFTVTLETAGAQLITATDQTTNSITGSESGITVQAAAAKTLIVAGFPTSDTAGTSASVTVTAYDAYGNVATGYAGTVALTSSDPHAALPSNYTFTGSDKGKHTFSGTLDTAGSQSITATDQATQSITGVESGITVAAAAAKTLTVSGFSTSDTAGTSGTVTVTAYDAYGNLATGYRGTISVTSSDPHALLPANYTFTSGDAGSHSFSVTLDTAGVQSITATDHATHSITGADSGIAVQAAAAKTMTITGFPTSDRAGTAGTVTVTAYDAYGNVATGYTGTVALTSTDPDAVLPANYIFTAGDAGTHSFSVTLETSGTQSITASDTVTPSLSAGESGITVAAAAAKTLTVGGFSATDTAGTSGTVTVTAYDAYGNVATGYTGTVALTSTDPQAVLPATYTFTGGDAGTHSFSVTLDTAGSQSITATDQGTHSITGAESAIAVQAAAANTLSVTGFPTSDTAGAVGAVTVTAYDAYGNVATGYTGMVALSSTDPRALLPANYTFTDADAGEHSFSVTLETSGTQSITATDSGTSSIMGTESAIAVQAAAAQTLSVTGFPANDTAGASGTVTVTAYDAYGNVATGYIGTLILTSTDSHAVLPSNFTFTAADASEHSFAVTLETSGTQSITATDAGTSSIMGTESAIAVQAAAAQTLSVTGFSTSDTAGTSGNVTVTAYDAYGNVATGYTGTILLSSTDPRAVLPANYTFIAAAAGEHSFAVTLDTAGTQSITATDTGTSSITGSESGITVQAAAAKTLTVTGFPTSDSAGASGTITVTAYDAYGNVATGYTGTVLLTSSDPKASLPSSYTFTAADGGQHAFDVALDTAGTQSITATDTSLSGLSASEAGIAVQPAAAATFSVAGLPSVIMAGTPATVTVTAHDAYGNVATGYTGTVLLTSSDPLAELPSSYTFTAADAGVHPFAVTLETAGPQSITATDTASASVEGAETGITVRAIPQINWSAPESIVYGTPLGLPELDASANVPGSFTYTPAAGAILAVGGSQTLSVTFTPENSTDYTMSSATTTITVTQATPILAVSAGGGPYNGSPYAASATIAGAVAGALNTPAARLDNIAPTLTYYVGSGTTGASLGSTPPSVPGTYTVVAAFAGDANYLAATSAPVTFTIGQGTATTVAPISTEVVLVQTPIYRQRKLMSVELTVKITPSDSGGGLALPTGQVTLELLKKTKKKKTKVASTLGSAAVTGGQATLLFKASKVANRSIAIVYSGDANDAASTLPSATLI